MINAALRGLSYGFPLILAAVLAQLPAQEARSEDQETLHILMVADTTDESIGNSCITDLATLKRYFSESTNIPKNRLVRITFMTGSPPPNARPAPSSIRVMRFSHFTKISRLKETSKQATLSSSITQAMARTTRIRVISLPRRATSSTPCFGPSYGSQSSSVNLAWP